MKSFSCGLCNDGIKRTRKGLRNHLREHVRNKFTNEGYKKGVGYIKQKWWIEYEGI